MTPGRPRGTGKASNAGTSAYASLTADDKSALRAWGIANTKIRGDRGRVPDSVVQEWNVAGK